jgi:hypothetical protein
MFLPWSTTASRTPVARRRKISPVFPLNAYIDVSKEMKKRSNKKNLKKKRKYKK